MSFSIRKFLGIKTWAERYIEQVNIRSIERQIKIDLEAANRIEIYALEEYVEWKNEQILIEGLDKTKPYWRMQIPIRCSKYTGGIYEVAHPETAKYLNVNWQDLINKRVEELKNATTG